EFGHRAAAGYRSSEAGRPRTIEHQGAVVDDISLETAARTAVADLQRAAVDGGAPSIRVGRCEGQRPRPRLDQGPHPGCGAAEGRIEAICIDRPATGIE